MKSKLLRDIYNRFFIEDSKNIVVVLNRDGVLCQDEFARTFTEEFGIKIAKGDGLWLRIIKEVVSVENPDLRILFVTDKEFDLLPDIAQVVDYYELQTKSLFRLYAWDAIKNESFHVLSRLYETPQMSKLSSSETTSLALRIKSTISDHCAEYQVETTKLEITPSVDFNNPTPWMNATAKIILQSLKSDRWGDLLEKVDEINCRFQQFLANNFSMIQSSGCPQHAPKIVTHVQTFLKRKRERCALVVVDGMNYWQGHMLMDSIKRNLGRDCSCECMYSWLPSTTELSRQAIFKGSYPSTNYDQSPTNEKSLWKSYWTANGYADFQIYYQHSGQVNQEHAVDRLAYVNTDLDEMMHNSKNYKYLYSLTDIWVNEEEILSQVKHLVACGYKVYITTDHGNIEGVPYKKLRAQEKLGSTFSLRHISISTEMDKDLFKDEHGGHITQISKNNTFYTIEREIFHTEECVTHGGTHWLEVLIPFITIN